MGDFTDHSQYNTSRSHYSTGSAGPDTSRSHYETTYTARSHVSSHQYTFPPDSPRNAAGLRTPRKREPGYTPNITPREAARPLEQVPEADPNVGGFWNCFSSQWSQLQALTAARSEKENRYGEVSTIGGRADYSAQPTNGWGTDRSHLATGATPREELPGPGGSTGTVGASPWNPGLYNELIGNAIGNWTSTPRNWGGQDDGRQGRPRNLWARVQNARALFWVSFGNGKFVQFTCGVKPLLKDPQYCEMLTAAWVFTKWRKLIEKKFPNRDKSLYRMGDSLMAGGDGAGATKRASRCTCFAVLLWTFFLSLWAVAVLFGAMAVHLIGLDYAQSLRMHPYDEVDAEGLSWQDDVDWEVESMLDREVDTATWCGVLMPAQLAACSELWHLLHPALAEIQAQKAAATAGPLATPAAGDAAAAGAAVAALKMDTAMLDTLREFDHAFAAVAVNDSAADSDAYLEARGELRQALVTIDTAAVEVQQYLAAWALNTTAGVLQGMRSSPAACATADSGAVVDPHLCSLPVMPAPPADVAAARRLRTLLAHIHSVESTLHLEVGELREEAVLEEAAAAAHAAAAASAALEAAAAAATAEALATVAAAAEPPPCVGWITSGADDFNAIDPARTPDGLDKDSAKLIARTMLASLFLVPWIWSVIGCALRAVLPAALTGKKKRAGSAAAAAAPAAPAQATPAHPLSVPSPSQDVPEPSAARGVGAAVRFFGDLSEPPNLQPSSARPGATPQQGRRSVDQPVHLQSADSITHSAAVVLQAALIQERVRSGHSPMSSPVASKRPSPYSSRMVSPLISPLASARVSPNRSRKDSEVFTARDFTEEDRKYPSPATGRPLPRPRSPTPGQRVSAPVSAPNSPPTPSPVETSPPGLKEDYPDLYADSPLANAAMDPLGTPRGLLPRAPGAAAEMEAVRSRASMMSTPRESGQRIGFGRNHAGAHMGMANGLQPYAGQSRLI